MDPSTAHYLLLNRQRRHRVNTRELRQFVTRLLPVLRVENRSFAVVFVTDTAMRRFNRTYRHKDRPTDVLSFGGQDGYLGDILISSETAYNQARRSPSLSFQKNLKRLLLHGLLHLMGYDHESDEGQMRALETRLRRRFQC